MQAMPLLARVSLHPRIAHSVRARRVALAACAAALVATTAAACSGEDASGSSLPKPSNSFCTAARKYDDRVVKGAGIDEQIRLVTQMATTAPKDVAHDAKVFLDALERRRDGDKSVVDNPKIEKAVTNVERRVQNGCQLFSQPPGGGI
jgi:hypothetical protein